MVNPSSKTKLPLEILLPEQDHDMYQTLTKQIKQDSTTHKTSPFLPAKSTPSKKDDKNMKYNNSGKDLLLLSH